MTVAMVILAGAVSLPLGSSAWAVEPRPVTLQEAFRSATTQTEVLSIAQARVEQAHARVDQARASLFPLFLRKEFGNQREPISILIHKAQSQNLFAGGKDISQLNRHNSGLQAEEKNKQSSRLGLFSQVANLFYSVLSGQKELETLKKITELAEARVKEIRERTKIGKSRNIELLAANAQVSVLKAEQQSSLGALSTALDQLTLLTGLPREITLLEEASQEHLYQIQKPLDVFLSRLEKRPDLISLSQQVEEAQSLVNVARAGHYPTLGADANYYLTRSRSAATTSSSADWDVGLTLTLPLFSGGLVQAEVSEASHRVAELESSLGNARRKAELEIRTAYNHFQSAHEQLQALESALASTDQNYQEQARNYRFSQATNLDVIQALNLFQDTKRTFDRTRYQAMIYWAELRAATADESI